jgi:hypothetical protein
MDNSLVMDLTYEELLLNIKGENKNNFCIELDENSNWNIIKNMTYKELIEAYLSSAEFEKSIIDLKIKSEKRNKKISALYIEAYINLALTYTDFYSSIPLKKAKSLSKGKTYSTTLTAGRKTYYFKYANIKASKIKLTFKSSIFVGESGYYSVYAHYKKQRSLIGFINSGDHSYTGNIYTTNFTKSKKANKGTYYIELTAKGKPTGTASIKIS